MNKLLFSVFLIGSILVGNGLAGHALSYQVLSAQRKKKDKTEGNSLSEKEAKMVNFLFYEGLTAFHKGELDEAKEFFTKILDVSKDQHTAHFYLGKIAMVQERSTDAVNHAEKALKLDPENYWYYDLLVSAHEATMNLDKALAVQVSLAEKFPEDKDALYRLAQMYISAKDYEQSVQTYTRLEELVGFSEEIAFRKHQLYIFLNQPEKALTELDKLIQVNPQETQYYQAKYDVLLMNRENERALTVLQDLLAADPDNAFALLAMADYYKSQGNMTASDEYLFRAFENPGVDLQAKVSILSGLYPYAEDNPQTLERILTLGRQLYADQPGDAMVNGILGDIYQVASEPDSARVYYRRSAELEPANEKVWEELLFLDSEEGDYTALLKDSEEALSYFPNQALFLFFMGIGSAEIDDFDQARYAFEKVKKIGPDNKGLLLQATIALAEVYAEQGNFDKADENYNAALEQDPGNPLVMNNYAYSLAQRGERLKDAESLAQRALKISPGTASFMDTYGFILYQQGEYEGAREWFEKALEAGESPEIQAHYGSALLMLGDEAAARAYFEKARAGGLDIDIEALMKGIK